MDVRRPFAAAGALAINALAGIGLLWSAGEPARDERRTEVVQARLLSPDPPAHPPEPPPVRAAATVRGPPGADPNAARPEPAPARSGPPDRSVSPVRPAASPPAGAPATRVRDPAPGPPPPRPADPPARQPSRTATATVPTVADSTRAPAPAPTTTTGSAEPSAATAADAGVTEPAATSPVAGADPAFERAAAPPGPLASAAAFGPRSDAAHGRLGPRVDASWAGNAAPRYPSVARRLGEQGEVRLDVHVGADGSVLDVRLRTSSGSAALDRSAIDAVRQWRFTPARSDGEPVAEWYRDWKWVFRLEG